MRVPCYSISSSLDDETPERCAVLRPVVYPDVEREQTLRMAEVAKSLAVLLDGGASRPLPDQSRHLSA
jgi:hypothetical protein